MSTRSDRSVLATDRDVDRLDSTPARRVRTVQPDFDQSLSGHIGSRAMTGAVIGAVVLGVGVTLLMLVTMGSNGQALGIGLAVALTGGPFFGGLVGFALAVHAAEKAATEEAALAQLVPATVASWGVQVLEPA